MLDGWREVQGSPSGRTHRVRAFPPRLLHVIAGNAPGVAALTVLRGALTKGVHLIKLPSNDLFTATAILRALNVNNRTQALFAVSRLGVQFAPPLRGATPS